ncbi:MAG: 4Fe-4S binding protein [Halanaerobiales bacterium]|nr:4Fe-4S binding protein [Halanaerobiales bacterium]
MIKRKIVEINEELCNGCGLCIPACHEGAIQLIDGKARVIDDKFCDGLGDCLSECPQGAIKIVEREAAEYDQEAVEKRLALLAQTKDHAAHGGCPGSRMMVFEQKEADANQQLTAVNGGDLQIKIKSQLTHWPVQLMLVPEQAPYFNGKELLITADCVPFTYPDYHLDLLRNKSVVVGCPKLDDLEYYIERLTAIFSANDLTGLTVAFMEVPCCSGIVKAVETALARSGKDIPLQRVKIGIKGNKENIDNPEA